MSATSDMDAARDSGNNEMPAYKDEGPGVITARASDNQIANTTTTIVQSPPDDRKRFETLRAELARLSIGLYELADGSYLASRWNLSRPLRDLHAVAAWVRQIGGAA